MHYQRIHCASKGSADALVLCCVIKGSTDALVILCVILNGVMYKVGDINPAPERILMDVA